MPPQSSRQVTIMQISTLRLKKREEQRILSGHPWIYSNEIDVAQTPLSQLIPGQLVQLESNNGKPLGTAYANPHSLICARLISRDPKIFLDKALLLARLKQALALREQLFDKPFYRLVFGESDQLPGLIVDRYGDVLVVQLNTAGMENIKALLAESLIEVLQPKAILLRNDSAMRKLEGLNEYVEPLFGNPPEKIEIIEGHTRFSIPIFTGQKTGWFYDQRNNRMNLQKYVANKRVLDVFSYIGGWGIQAANFGANEVICVDSSKQALTWVAENAQLNQLEQKVQTLNEDAFTALTNLREAGEHFDVIILDPPAFMKRRKDSKEGLNAYRRLNELAMRLFKQEGILISASCSLHLQRDALVDVLRAASNHRNLPLQILEEGHQAPDHPIHPAIPETNYLKAFFTRVLPTN